MKALVIYDSFFGNTEQIAQTIGKALAAHAQVEILRANEVKSEHWQGLDLLFIGSPTRAFKATAAIYTLISSIPRHILKTANTAAFDTRIPVSEVNSAIGRFFIKRFGYAAEKIAKRLKKQGGKRLVPAEGFTVLASEGPLKEGELLRAEQWAEEIVQILTNGK